MRNQDQTPNKKGKGDKVMPVHNIQKEDSPMLDMLSNYTLQFPSLARPSREELGLTAPREENTVVYIYTLDYQHPYIPTIQEKITLVDRAPTPSIKQLGYTLDGMTLLRYWGMNGRQLPGQAHSEVSVYQAVLFTIKLREQQAAEKRRAVKQAWNEAWEAHVMRARNAEKAARLQRSREWAQKMTERRLATQERAAKAKAKKLEQKAREEQAFLNWQEEQGWLDIFPWLKSTSFWAVRKAEDPGSWGPLTTQIDEVLAAHNKAVREARAAGKAYAQGRAAARKARREDNAGLGGGKCEAFKPNAKRKAWQKGEKRAAKVLARKRCKALLNKQVLVKVTKEVTRVVPQTPEFRSLVIQARGLARTLNALTAVGLETIEYNAARMDQVMDYLAALEQYRPYAPAVRSWSKNQHKKAKPFKHGTESNKLRRAVENGRKALDATPAWLAYVPREDADDLVARYYEVEAQLIEVNAKIAALKAARTTETVIVNYYETISKKDLKALKKSEAVTVDMGTFGADSVPMVEVSMGKLSSAVAGTVPVAIKA